MKNEKSVIAIECKTVRMPLKHERGQLRSYFNDMPVVKIGVITAGLSYEFYADSDELNMMNTMSFLVLDFRDIDKDKIENSINENFHDLTSVIFST